MGKMQRDKGKRGEREVVQIMQSLGWTEARRSRQSDGAVDPDVAGCDPLWIEVKRRKSIAACRFMDQCDEDTKRSPPPPAGIYAGRRWGMVSDSEGGPVVPTGNAVACSGVFT